MGNLTTNLIDLLREQVSDLSAEQISQGGLEFDLGTGSSGLDMCLSNFAEYGLEVLENRQFPSLFDGLKPVQRYLVWAMYNLTKGDTKAPVKSTRVIGDVTDLYHSHGDESVYLAMSRMVDTNGSMKVPMFVGDGDLGNLYSDGSPAQKRYTKVSLHRNALDMVANLNGVDFIQSTENDEASYPSDLPTKYPFAFIGAVQSGIAVGLSTVTANYDISEVADLVIEYLETGEMTKVLAPDYTTGGYIVNDKKAFTKLAKTGKARIKVRGKMVAKGRKLYLTDFPYGVKYEKLVDAINNLELKGVTAKNDSGGGEKPMIKITCPNKQSVEDVARLVLAKTKFQTYLNIQSRYLYNGKLVNVGLHKGLEMWVQKRSEILVKDYTKSLESLYVSQKRLSDFATLLSNKEKCALFLKLYTDTARPESDAVEVLKELGITDAENIRWILDRRVSVYRNPSRYFNELANLNEKIKRLEELKENPYIQIKQDMLELKQTWGKQYPRMSEVSNTDIVFQKAESLEEPCTVIVKNGLASFVSRGSISSTNSNYDYIIDTTTHSKIAVGLENGTINLIRVSDLSNGYPMSVGVPIDVSFQAKHKILFAEACEDGKEVYMLYRDGFISFVDLEPFNRKTNVGSTYVNALPVEDLSKVYEVGIWNNEVANRVWWQMDKKKTNWMPFDELKHKHRNARTRIVVPLEKAVTVIGTREEFEGKWFMQEKYKRARAVNYTMDNEERNSVFDFLKSLRESSED